MSKKTKNSIATITIILIIVGALLYFVYYASWSEEVSYELQNIDDDGNLHVLFQRYEITPYAVGLVDVIMQ